MKSATHCGRVGGVDIQKEAVFSLYAIGRTPRSRGVFTDLLEREWIQFGIWCMIGQLGCNT